MKKILNTQILLAMVTILLAGTACTKDKEKLPPGIPAEGYKIKTLDYGTGMRTHFYDASGRLVNVTRSDGSSNTSSYGPNSVTTQSLLPNGTLAQQDNLVLDASGLMISGTNSNNLPLVTTYFYNSDKQVIKQVNTESGVITRQRFYTYSNGNMVTDSVADGSGWYTYKYEYYTDIISTIENANYGSEYLGKGNKNVLKKMTYEVSSGGTPVVRNYDVPERDALHRITKTTYTISGGAPVVYKYTYY